MAEGVLFTPDAARRISAAVLNLERNAPGSIDRESPADGERGFFFARITGWNPSAPWQLSWVAQQPRWDTTLDPATFDPNTIETTYWENHSSGYSGSWTDNRYAFHPSAAPPINSVVKLAAHNPQAERSQRCYVIVQPERTTFVGKLVTAGPSSEPDYTDGRYWVREQAVTFDSYGRPSYSNATGGRHITAFNLEESGLGTNGTHGCLFKSGEVPSRGSSLTAPDRFVEVGLAGTAYVFRSPPFVFIPDSFYLDAWDTDGDGCLTTARKWWKGYLPFAIVDYDVTP